MPIPHQSTSPDATDVCRDTARVAAGPVDVDFEEAEMPGKRADVKNEKQYEA
jgi:hypothetical protein